MKIRFALPTDGQEHSYCLHCGREELSMLIIDGRLAYRCDGCKQTSSRALIIDPKITWWLDVNQEYWHEVSGIFVANETSEFLFFERTRHPFGLTVPAGHVDRGERSVQAAERELFEETGIQRTNLISIATTDIHGDECRRGSDVHRWHIFATGVPSEQLIEVDAREGIRPVWLGLDQVLKRDLTHATRQAIVRYREEILRAVQ